MGSESLFQLFSKRPSKPISQDSNSTSSSETDNFQRIVAAQNSALIQSQRKVFVTGNNLKAPVVNISAAEFTKSIHENLHKHQYRSIFPIQSKAWNEISSNRSVTIVNGRNSGKTMAFLPPLLSLLLENLDNSDEEPLQGPIAIIIVKSSRDVETLFKLCFLLAPKLKTVAAFGIWNFKQKCIELLNGCDLLITTPACFTRFTETDVLKMFDRKRIRHLVFENLDLMFEKFKTNIINILEVCTFFARAPEDNPQMIITATIWQQYFNEFLKLSNEPIIVIGSYIEAALFVKSRFSVSKMSQKDKNMKLLDYLDTFEWRLKKTALIFNTQTELNYFGQLLTDRSIGFGILDRNTKPFEIDEWIREENGRMTLLLVLDDVSTEFSIGFIQILIHYSLPPTWSAFSRRFRLSLGYFKSYYGSAVKMIENQPRIIIHLDETNSIEIPRILNFLTDRRLINQIPSNIQEEIQKIINNHEKAKSDGSSEIIIPLCTHVIKFAGCSIQKCSKRHVLMAADQPAFIPSSGRIKFKLIGSNSPLHYVIVITDYLADEFSEWISNNDRIENIQAQLVQLQNFMADEVNQMIEGCVKVGNVYGFFDSQFNEWRRCRVFKIHETDDEFTPKDVDITFIDCGGIKTVRSTALKRLPKDVRKLQPLAAHLRIINMVPYDFDEIFDYETIDVVERHLAKNISANDVIMCDIEMAIDDTIVSKNFHVYQRLVNCNTDILKISLRSYLLKNFYAASQLDILDRLRQIARQSNFEVIKKVKAAEIVVEKEVKFIERNLSIGKTYKAELLHFQDIGSFYVQIVDKNRKAMMRQLEELANCDCLALLDDVAVDKACLLKTDNVQSLRCVVTQVEPVLEVFLVDCGLTVKAQKTNLFKIPEKLCSAVPRQAIECAFSGFEKMIFDAQTFRKFFGDDGVFEMKVLSKCDKYLVALKDENGAADNLKTEDVEPKLTQRDIQAAMDGLEKMFDNDECVCLDEQDAIKLLGLPTTARFLPPSEMVEQPRLKEARKSKKSKKCVELQKFGDLKDGNQSKEAGKLAESEELGNLKDFGKFKDFSQPKESNQSKKLDKFKESSRQNESSQPMDLRKLKETKEPCKLTESSKSTEANQPWNLKLKFNQLKKSSQPKESSQPDEFSQPKEIVKSKESSQSKDVSQPKISAQPTEPNKLTQLTKSIKSTEPSQAQNIKSVPQVPKRQAKTASIATANIYANTNIEWNQNGQKVLLKVEAVNAVDYSLSITESTAEICVKYGNNKVSLSIFELYGRIVPEYCLIKSNGLEITIMLIKKFENILWPRLTFNKDVVATTIRCSQNEFGTALWESNGVAEKPECTGVPAGYFTDNEEFDDYDDALENDEVL